MTKNEALVSDHALSQMQAITAVSKMFDSATTASVRALGLSQMEGMTAVSKMLNSATAGSVGALNLPQMQAVTAVSKMFDSATTASVRALGLSQMEGMTAMSKMLNSATAGSVGALNLPQMQAITAVSKMFDSATAWQAWSPLFQDGGSFASAAAKLQRSNAAVASTLATVAAQRLTASHRGVSQGSFDGQFAAIARRIALEDIPVSLRNEHPEPAEDPRLIEAAAMNMGLSSVPAETKDRWILELLIGFTAWLSYVVVQIGMTADPITPDFLLGSIEAGSAGAAVVHWGPGVLERLRKPGPS
ncbi:hypothetical protein [Arthrobacter sp. zg-Y1143]|uniref:hypothetical protein n=1 Tax=Arthrobacter sp. zg-Y1143 TaxID=3049065 RepID=UPI0024C40C33|nr:hypothetical protein [Arthrobacter sp. zg-Y1143]MDK1326508.1 hypothetical protein [Arthrobacter sp. zg-Y1143]